MLLGPVLAAGTNSPVLFGRRLWAETRIALFEQAVDTRTPGLHLRESDGRVSFGRDWVKEAAWPSSSKRTSPAFRALVGTDLDEDPMACARPAGVPYMKALRLHNGTIYRWNRACFGVTEGRAHLRIENRIMPSGPSVLDQVANSAFWSG
ncbi:MAG: hypothetical protein IPF99_19890 [Deltaproteobacteria bacterium]|nr:hypothetical protein [Deltaproteobacteria bacterium]